MEVFYDNGHMQSQSYPGKCSANAQGDHIRPESPGAERAKELHAAWLRNPHEGPYQ